MLPATRWINPCIVKVLITSNFVRRKKPRRPHRPFPPTTGNNGRWCKKVRGKVHFFGLWADPQAALDSYLRVAADLHDAGRQPRRPTLPEGGVTVKDVCNHYLTHQQRKVDSGCINVFGEIPVARASPWGPPGLGRVFARSGRPCDSWARRPCYAHCPQNVNVPDDGPTAVVRAARRLYNLVMLGGSRKGINGPAPVAEIRALNEGPAGARAMCIAPGESLGTASISVSASGLRPYVGVAGGVFSPFRTTGTGEERRS